MINRTSFGKIPKHNMKAAEDFLEVVLFAHVITAAEEVMKAGNIRADCEVVADSIINNFVTVKHCVQVFKILFMHMPLTS